MSYKGLSLKVASLILLANCVPTYGTDYYSDRAYESLGVKGKQENPSNVVPYVNGDPNAQKRIDGAKPAPAEPATPIMPFALTNTQNNGAILSPARAVSATNINNDYYALYLETLANEYGKYANLFMQKSLQNDAQLLSSKADTAATGHDVVFETENSFELPLDKKAIVAHQRQTLENVKARIDILKEMPVVMGQLQASYDCMVIEAKNRVYSQNTVCGLAYFQALSAIEGRFGSVTTVTTPVSAPVATEMATVSVPQPVTANADPVRVNMSLINVDPNAVAVAPAAPTEPAVPAKAQEGTSHFVQHAFEYEDRAVLKYDNHKSFVVYYEMGASNLDSAAVYAINRAIAFAQDYDNYKINVLGFTDRVASRDFNKNLSQARVNGVVDALVKRGISKNKIKTVLFGEDYNSVNTRDGVGESFNRRVVIEVDTMSTFDEDTFIMQKASENVTMN